MELDRSALDQILERVVQYEKTVPRFEEVFDENQFRENINGQWQNFEEWFLRSDEKVKISVETGEEADAETDVKISAETDSDIDTENNADINTDESELEKKTRLFYQAGLLRDELSNDILVYGIHGILPDGKIHMGIEGFWQEKEPMRLTLHTVEKLKMSVPVGMETVTLEELQSLCDAMRKRKKAAYQECMMGQYMV